MTTNQAKGEISLRDALYELAAAKRIDATVLDEFARRYPQHATALTDFAVELALGGDHDGPDSEGEVDSSPAVSRAMSRFQNTLHAANMRAHPSRQAQASPLAALDRTDLRNTARNLGINTVFLMKLRDSQIQGHTIPIAFSQQVAEELRAPLDVVLASFAAGPRMQGKAHYKADQKPEVGAQQTFEEAVRGSGLSMEQQARLLAL